MSDDAPKAPHERADWYKQTSAASVGIEMAVAICGGALGGMYLERHYTHWAPWTTLIGLFVGIGAAGLAIARLVREHDAEMKARRAAGINLDGTPIEPDPPEPDLESPEVSTQPADPERARDLELDPELEAIRRRQKAKPLDHRGPLP